MLKYKNSDVGARVWKDIMAAPVWIPPATTPPEELIKGYWRKGKFKPAEVKDIHVGRVLVMGMLMAHLDAAPQRRARGRLLMEG